MLDLKIIRSQPEVIAENCRKRNVDVDIEKLLALDEQVRQITSEVDSVRQRRNDISNKMKVCIIGIIINKSSLLVQTSSKYQAYLN